MSFKWIHENPPYWDRNKAGIVGSAPKGIFDLGGYGDGDMVPGEWWRVEEDRKVLGYGWMDTTWGDAEILLAVDAAAQGKGVGTFIIDRLDEEAASRGLNYLYNQVRDTHPDPGGITRWLENRGFTLSHDDRLLRRSVRRGGSAR
jgi:GNAT superfamily N-acetyltransferase